MAEHLDGLWLTKIAIEQDQESLFSPKALAQNGFGVPESLNDHGKGWRASIPKARQNCRKLVPFRAVHGGVGVSGIGGATHMARKGAAVTAEHRTQPFGPMRVGLHTGSWVIGRTDFHPPSLAIPLARATLLCKNMSIEITGHTTTTTEPSHALYRP